jgi:hypothetical protein
MDPLLKKMAGTKYRHNLVTLVIWMSDLARRRKYDAFFLRGVSTQSIKRVHDGDALPVRPCPTCLTSQATQRISV